MIISRSVLLLIICITAVVVNAQSNTAPEVTNVQFEQRDDGSFIVDIYYDLYDAESNEMDVTMEVSEDAGQAYNLSATELTGDIGSGITSGTNKHIVWDFGAEHPNYFSDQIKIKIIADDGVVSMGEPCPGIPTVTYAGKTYNTVQIGNQCWLKENLDVGTMIENNDSGFLQSDNGVIEKFCYDNEPENCETYGGLYEWPEAMQYETTEGVQCICPNGWHIPTLVEFNELIESVSGDANSLKAIGQGYGDGAGTNLSGFNALLAGGRNGYQSYFEFYGITHLTSIWSSTESADTSAKMLYLPTNYNEIMIGSLYNKRHGFSLRCIKD